MPKPAALDIAYSKIETWILAGSQDSDLPDHYLKIFERWRKLDDLLDKYPVKKQAIAVYQKKYPDLSLSQIYYDIANTKKLFNNYNPHDKDRLRAFLINDITAQLKVYKDAGPKGFKAVNDAHKNLIVAGQLHIEDKESSVDPEVLENHNFYTIINIGGQPIKIDFRKFQELPMETKKTISDAINANPMTEDAAYEILNPDGEQTDWL